MKVMRKLCLALVVVLLMPTASFGSFSIFGSYWDTKDVGSAYGLGLRFGINLVPQLQLELGGTYYEDFQRDVEIEGEVARGELEAIPIDLGLRFDFGKAGGFYISGGATWTLLDTNVVDLDDQFGYYGILGVSFGGKLYFEVTYRSVEATVSGIDIPGLEFDPELIDVVVVDLTGWGANVGFRW